jgi:flagellar basal body-associated protein FliL
VVGRYRSERPRKAAPAQKENALTIVWIIIVIILVLLAIGLARRVL